ncbi:unnamed protein product [Rotaria sp. Silwood2]|nr:unnamed protein product [Rotaria sp. Silwood2]
MLHTSRLTIMIWLIFIVTITALTNTRVMSTETKYSRTKMNLFDPVLSANSYTGHIKENEYTGQIEPPLSASDADPSNSLNGKICGYEVSWHKHDDIVDDITRNVPFTVDLVNNQPILKFKSNIDTLDCEIQQTYRMYIRAYDCAPIEKRRYSERSSLIITVDDVNEYAPVFTHSHYLFKLHENQTCDSASCRVEATDDDCANQDHQVCGYKIITPNVPFSINSNGIISTTATLNNDQYEFDVMAIDCDSSNNNSRMISQSARVTLKIIKSCKPIINDNAPSKLVIQSDHIHLFDTVNVNACDETCNVQDIVGTVELDTNGLDSGCNHDQCSRASRLVQHFHGQLSGLIIEQKEELQRSSNCIRECHQYLDIPDVQSGSNVEFVSNSNRSVWILRTDTTESYEELLKHLVYRNTFEPIGPYGQRKITIRTRVKCLGEVNTYDLPTFTRYISIDEPKVPVKIELKGDTNYLVPEDVINRGIYLFRTLSIYTNAMKKNQGDIKDCTVTAIPSLSKTEQLIIPEVSNLEKQVTKQGAMISGIESIDAYQSLFRQIAYISQTPVTYVDRTFTLSCAGVYDQVFTNEIRVRVRIEKQMAPSAPVAAVLSNKLVVDNDQVRDNIFNVNDEKPRTQRNVSDWPIAVVVCISIGLAGVLVLYLIVRIRSSNRQHNPNTNTGDDIHSQMEWEDDIGLNITVNPLDETKKPVQSINMPNVEQTMDEYPGSSSDDEGEEYENDDNNHNEYSSDDDGYENNQVHPKKHDHQLEWDDAAIEYGPKKV